MQDHSQHIVEQAREQSQTTVDIMTVCITFLFVNCKNAEVTKKSTKNARA